MGTLNIVLLIVFFIHSLILSSLFRSFLGLCWFPAWNGSCNHPVAAEQKQCLVSLWNVESGWNVTATNPSSGAYGIPQALPGSKMASAGADWQTSAATQIRWGLGYIKSVYGSPCGAWGHEQADGWY